MTWQKIEGYRGLREYHGKNGTTYQVLLRVGDGVISETYKNKMDAIQRLDELRGKRQTGDLQYRNIRLGQYCDKWLDHQRVAKGIRETSLTELGHRIDIIKRYFDPSMQLKRVSIPLIREFEVYMADELKLSKNRQNHVFSTLKRILRDAREDGYNAVEPPARKRYTNNKDDVEAIPFQPDELELFLKSSGEYGRFYHDFFKFMAFTGLRMSEALALTWEDVDLANRRIEVNKQWYRGRIAKPKTHCSKRTVSIYEPIMSMLHDRRKEVVEFYLRKPEYKDLDLVFPGPSGKHREPSGIAHIFKRSLRRAKLPLTLSPHNLRHTFASFLFSFTENILFASKRLGHSNASITLNVYAHLLKKDESEIENRINENFATFFNKGVAKLGNF